MTAFDSELGRYVARISQFDRKDWLVYCGWVGLMLGLTASTLAFVAFAHQVSAPVPGYAWMVPVGAAIFAGAIAVDTIGHRTIYKAALGRAEGLVHQLTIFCGIGSCVLLCAAYPYPDLFFIPGSVLMVLSFVYSLVDEVFHWHRYWTQQSDPVEMWSHLFILIGHGTMMAAWWAWAYGGYVGVAEVVAAAAM